jgi:hypothetical protein
MQCSNECSGIRDQTKCSIIIIIRKGDETDVLMEKDDS